MNYEELDTKIESLINSADIANGNGDFRQVWDEIKQIGLLFKEIRYPSRSDKDVAWNRFQDIVARIKIFQADLRERQSQAINNLIERIEKLAVVLDKDHRQVDWRDVWKEIRSVSQEFKSIRFLSKDQREQHWTQFQDIVEKIKETQEKRHREREEFSLNSKEHKEFILCHVKNARPITGIIADLLDGGESMIDSIIPGPEIDRKKEMLQYHSEELKQARHAFSERKNQMLGRDKHEVFEAILETQELLNFAWEQWREFKNKAYQAKQSAWRERIKYNIDKLEDKLSYLYDKLSKRESHLLELEDKRADAWSESFREVVNDWIDEERDRIYGLKEKIRDVEGWIDDERNKLHR